RLSRARKALQLIDGTADELPLEVVQRSVDRGARRELARRQPPHDLLDRERIVAERRACLVCVGERRLRRLLVPRDRSRLVAAGDAVLPDLDPDDLVRRDRKSTRLNSSHLGISYAVFCLKKKK